MHIGVIGVGGVGGYFDDTLPARFFQDSTDSFARGIDRQEFRKAQKDYYLYRGWTEEGVPTETKLSQLGLELD
ncbi:MAG: aldehyde ferredoxin oxidoreductase C-terminal domain-containing protein [Bacillota bacterium]